MRGRTTHSRAITAALCLGLLLGATRAIAQSDGSTVPCSTTDRSKPRADLLAKAALKAVEECAAVADPVAQNELGRRYGLGMSGVTRDSKRSFELYQTAAATGYVQAQANLAYMYLNGEGTSKDLEKAYHWGLLAAEAGFAQAQYQVGFMHVTGTGVPQDGRLAEKWFLAAADQGFVRAQGALANLYSDGKLLPNDPARAVMWLHRERDAQLTGRAWRKGDEAEIDPMALRPEDMPRVAQKLIQITQANSSVKLDYSPASLKDLDGFIERAWSSPAARQPEEGPILMFGCYLGQVFARNLGLAWVMPERSNTPQGLTYPVLRASDGNVVDPVAEVRKSFQLRQNGRLVQLYADSTKRFTSVGTATSPTR